MAPAIRRAGRVVASALVLTLIPAGIPAARAGDTVELRRGTRVRVVAPPRVNEPTTGSLRAATDDSLFIAIPGPETLRLPVDLVQSLEFNRGRSASADAAIGCAAGAALGATVAALAIERSDLKDALVTVSALIGGAVGLLIGIAYGRSHDRWTTVEPSRVRVVVAPRGDAVGFAIGF